MQTAIIFTTGYSLLQETLMKYNTSLSKRHFYETTNHGILVSDIRHAFNTKNI